MLKTLALTLILLCTVSSAYPVDAQDIYHLPAAYWRGEPMDLNLYTAHDSINVVIPPLEKLYWSTPRTLRVGEADSVGIWGMVPDGSSIQVGTAIDTNNDRIMATLKGPLEYGCHWVRFTLDAVGPHTYANYIVVTQGVDKWSSIDAADLASRFDLAVENTTAIENPKVRWFTFPLCAYVYYGTLTQAIEHLPKPAAYITSDGKQYVLGR